MVTLKSWPSVHGDLLIHIISLLGELGEPGLVTSLLKNMDQKRKVFCYSPIKSSNRSCSASNYSASGKVLSYS